LSIKSGDQIPIEQRAADEVRFLCDEKITPDGVEIYNPAFDVTPAENITAIISEKGTIRQLTEEKIRRMLGQKLWQRKTRKI
jgi:methylthioribose-1-phosphate isomerase